MLWTLRNGGMTTRAAGLAARIDRWGEATLRRFGSCLGQRRTDLARIGATTGRVGALLLSMAVLPAVADPPRVDSAGPEDADLRQYADCSKMAAGRALSFEEVSACTRVFMKIKLSFVPGIELDDLDGLQPQQRAAVNLVGYQRFLAWRSESAARTEALTDEPVSPSAVAVD